MAALCKLVSWGQTNSLLAMPKRSAGPKPVKKAEENEQGISVLDLPERQLDLDTDESGSESDSEQGFSSDDANEGAQPADSQEASDDEDGWGDEIGKSALDLMKGPQAAAGGLGDVPQDRRDRTAEAGTSDAQSDSDSSEDERPSRNTGHLPTKRVLATSRCDVAWRNANRVASRISCRI